MNRTALYVGVVSAVIAGTIVVGTGGAQDQARPTGTLDVIGLERDATFRFVDNPPRQGEHGHASAGDTLTIVQLLRDAANRRAGLVRGFFIQTAGHTFNAVGSATFKVEGGTITVAGVIDDRGRSDRSDTVAITGGTGTYEGAGGTLTVTDRPRRSTFHFDFGG